MSEIERRLGAPAGSEVEVPLDLVVSDDWTTPALLAPLERLGTDRTAVPLILVHDHTRAPATYEGDDRATAERLTRVRDEVARRFGATTLIGRGIQHHALPEAGRIRPGMRVLANDSHAATLAAWGALAFAGQPTTVAAALHDGVLRTRVPETLRVHVTGRLRNGAGVRDAALQLLRAVRDDDGVPVLSAGRAIEFVGPGIRDWPPDRRALLANATPEAAAVTTLFPGAPDLAGHDVGSAPARELELDLDGIAPSLAHGPNPGDVTAVDATPWTRVDAVFVGTCAGGTWEEIAAFAEALDGPVVVPTDVAPATSGVADRLERSGMAAHLRRAGVALLPPGCGACFGFGTRRLRPGEVAVTTGNRNGRGRMGSPQATIVLASGRTAGLAARSGSVGGGGVRHPTTSTRQAGFHAPRDVTDPSVVPPTSGNVLRLHGPISTDDLAPSSVPGVGRSNDDDPAVLRRLFLHHRRNGDTLPNLAGCLLVADHAFGMGSNRASSVRALVAVGIRAVVARSVAPLYAQGARDEGVPIVELDDDAFHRACTPEATVALDLSEGTLAVNGRTWRIPPESSQARAIRTAGGIVPWILQREGRGRPALG